MKVMQASEAKNRFGELLESSATGPVVIRKNGRDVAVVVSKAEYDKRVAQVSKQELVRRYHEESIEEFSSLYEELAK